MEIKTQWRQSRCFSANHSVKLILKKAGKKIYDFFKCKGNKVINTDCVHADKAIPGQCGDDTMDATRYGPRITKAIHSNDINCCNQNIPSAEEDEQMLKKKRTYQIHHYFNQVSERCCFIVPRDLDR